MANIQELSNQELLSMLSDEDFNSLAKEQGIQEKPQAQPSASKFSESNPFAIMNPFTGRQAFTGATPERGQRTALGNIFERPSKAVTAAIRAPFGQKIEAYKKGAVVPEEVKTFTEQSQETTPGGIIPLTDNKLLNQFALAERSTKGYLRDIGATALDIAVNPADLALMLAGKVPLGKGRTVGGQLAKTKGVKKVGDILSKERHLKAPFEKQLANTVDNAYKKTIGIKVKGKPTAKRTTKQIEKTREAVKTIIENKSSLQFIDETGKPIQKLPESVQEFSQGIEQTKKVLLNKLDDLAKTTTERGGRVSTNKSIKVLDDFINNEAIKKTNPSAIKQAQALRDSIGKERISTTTANDMIKIWNDEGGAFFRGQVTADPKIISLKGKLATSLKESLIETVEGATGSQFRLVRNKLGSLLSIEDDVGRKAVALMNQQAKKGAIPQITEIFSNAQIARGILTANPGDIAAGATQKATLAMIKKLNNPNRIIANMFKNVDKIGFEFTQTLTPEILTDIPVSQFGRLRGPTSQLRLPSPRNVPYNPSGVRNVGGAPLRTPNVVGGQPIAGKPPIPNVPITPEAQRLLTFDPRFGRGKRFGKWFTARNP